jgi:hypothetical protein
MNDIYSIQIRSLSIQFLETLYILDNSKNIETIQGRIEFLETVIANLLHLENQSDYQYFVQMGIDDYNVRYINRIVSEADLTRLKNPSGFDFEDYGIYSILNGLNRYFEEQKDEINFLQNSSSKEKRISKVIHNILLAKNYLRMKFSESKSYNSGMEEIEKTIAKIKELHSTI